MSWLWQPLLPGGTYQRTTTELPATPATLTLTGIAPTLTAAVVNQLRIRGPSAADGDFYAWWPDQRSHIQIVYTDGTVVYVEVIAAVNNLDGTMTLTVDDNLPVGATPLLISWLELCRLEADELEVKFTAQGFEISTTARVVQQ